MISEVRTYVIIPGYNEEKYLDVVLRKVLPITRRVLYVDDGSHDRSVAIAKKRLEHVLVHEVNLGKGAAMRTGADYAFSELGADAVIFLDADDQHEPQELPRFERELEKGAGLVFGVRKFSANTPLFRFLGNKTASVVIHLLFGVYIPDVPSGYKAIAKKVYRKVAWRSSGYEVEAEIAALAAKHKLPFTVLEIASIYHDADKGMTLLDGLKIAGRLIQWKLEL